MRFQYLGSRGAQLVAVIGSIKSPHQFQYLGSRGAQPVLRDILCYISKGFQYLGSRGAQPHTLHFKTTINQVSILGLARSPTKNAIKPFPCKGFQYLGSRGAQPAVRGLIVKSLQFQYLGSRGAQLRKHCYANPGKCFNTWAREEPNVRLAVCAIFSAVSILGLARSPTLPTF